VAGKKQIIEKVYENLIRSIISMDYSPGQVLNESNISHDFGLNRVQVREVFQQLKDKKFLTIIPRYGAQVSLIDFRYMKYVFEGVRILEGYATRLAAERISDHKIRELEDIVKRMKGYNIETEFKTIILEDERFHKIMSESSQNGCLREILFDLKMHTERLWFYFQQDLNDSALFYETLSNIVEAVKIRDVERAELLAKQHIDDFVGLIKRKLL